jgi:hypothetical protein
MEAVKYMLYTDRPTPAAALRHRANDKTESRHLSFLYLLTGLDGEREVVLSLILAAGKTKVQEGKEGVLTLWSVFH